MRPAPAAVPVTRIGPRRSLLDVDFRELWAYRDILYFLAWRDVKVRYKQAALGILWAIIQPVATTVVFVIIFAGLAGLSTDGQAAVPFYLAGVLAWTYFAASLTGVTNAMVQNQNIVTKVYFPRLLLPFSAVLPPLVDFAVGLVLLGAVMAWYGIGTTTAVLLLPVFLLLAIATALGVGTWMSALNARFRDVKHVLPFLVQVWMFLSPVAYAASVVPPSVRWIYALNPMTTVVEGFRWAVFGASPGVDVTMALISAGAVVVILVTGVLFFRRVEHTVADYV